MDTMVNIARVARAREAIELLNNLIALVGLCAFGIPVTRATITSLLAGWALIGAAGMQLGLKYLGSLADAKLVTVASAVHKHRD